MTLGELKQELEKLDLPDDALVEVFCFDLQSVTLLIDCIEEDPGAGTEAILYVSPVEAL